MPYGQLQTNNIETPISDSLYKLLKHIEEKTNQECTCTPEQEKGIDPSVCESCAAARTLNEIRELIKQYHGDLIDD